MARLGYTQRIRARIQQLETIVDAATAELDELRVAERVLGRLGSEDESKGPDDGQTGTPTTKEGTVADMAIAALARNGPADTPTILGYLQQNWRSDLKQTTLASTLSRAKGEGRVFVVDGKWHVAGQTKEPPLGGSQAIGEDGDSSNADDGGSDPFA